MPENRGGGSGIWSREEKCPLGKVRALHWALSDGDYTELSLGRYAFPRVYLRGHVECKNTDLFGLYIAELFKLGSPELFVSILDAVSKQAREEGETAARLYMRVALGFGTDIEGAD